MTHLFITVYKVQNVGPHLVRHCLWAAVRNAPTLAPPIRKKLFSIVINTGVHKKLKATRVLSPYRNSPNRTLELCEEGGGGRST